MKRPVIKKPGAGKASAPEPSAPKRSKPKPIKVRRGSAIGARWHKWSQRVRASAWRIWRRVPTDVARVLVVTALILGSLIYVADWAESNATCTQCHDMGVQVQEPHDKVSCVSCHRPPGVAGMLRHGASYARMAVDGLALNKKFVASASHGAVDQGSCVSCHSKVFKADFDKGKPVKLSHRHILDLGVPCGRCHVVPGHSKKAAVLATKPAMSECLRCHDGRKAKSDCDLCHAGKGSDSAPSRRVVVPVSMRRDPSCRGCHPQRMADNCAKCHGGYEMPHPAGWAEGGHYFDGLVDKEDCWNCHEPYAADRQPGTHKGGAPEPNGGFCAKCHEFPSPHGSSSAWVKGHVVASRSLGMEQPGCICHGTAPIQRCETCHRQETCQKCHDERDRRRGVARSAP